MYRNVMICLMPSLAVGTHALTVAWDQMSPLPKTRSHKGERARGTCFQTQE